MAEKKTYPKIPVKAWAVLRQRAAAAPNAKLTPNLIATVLGGSPESAMNNVVRPLRQMGLVDEDGSLTPRGDKWRTEKGYADACSEIVDAVYPDELAGLVDDSGEPDQAQVRSWFLHEYGESNATQMARTYALVASKKIPEPVETNSNNGTKKIPAKKAPAKKAPEGKFSGGSGTSDEKQPPPPADTQQPSLHLDIQIHIPPGASAEELDRIFESMAKHLYNR